MICCRRHLRRAIRSPGACPLDRSISLCCSFACFSQPPQSMVYEATELKSVSVLIYGSNFAANWRLGNQVERVEACCYLAHRCTSVSLRPAKIKTQHAALADYALHCVFLHLGAALRASLPLCGGQKPHCRIGLSCVFAASDALRSRAI